MEKYGVKIDKNKVVEREKQASKNGNPPPRDTTINVPKDPDEGTEPYEAEE